MDTTPTNNEHEPLRLFFSYCHKDRDLRSRLDAHLSLLKSQSVISGWYDREILPGAEWEAEIEENLDAADIILLLISADFIGSAYCTYEAEKAIDRHNAGSATVIPIILRPVDWAGAPYSKLQALPTDAKPVTKWGNRDEAFADIAKGIRRAASTVRSTEERPSSRQQMPEICNLPLRRNINFVGRQSVFSSLIEWCRNGRSSIRILYGLGGVGKSQIALEFANRIGHEFQLVWWVSAQTRVALNQELAALASPLDLPEKDEPDQVIVLNAVIHWLSENANWLLVIDNASDPEFVTACLPDRHHGCVLVTSRNPFWRSHGEAMEVLGFGESESIEFLQRRTGIADPVGATNLAGLLGHLPLALEQSAAYIEKTQRPYSDYIEIFKGCSPDLLDAELAGKSVAGTMEVSLQSLAGSSALQILYLCSFLDSDGISESILQDSTEILPAGLADVVKSPLNFDKCVIDLLRYSLANRNDGQIFVHPIVQTVLRDRLANDERMTWACVAVKAVHKAFPDGAIAFRDVRTWPKCATLLRHVFSVAEHSASNDAERLLVADLLDSVGSYLRGRGELDDARALYHDAMTINEALLPADSHRLAIDKNNIAGVLHDIGALQEARTYFEEALEIDRRVHGPNHLETGTRLNNLGLVLQDIGDLRAAQECFEEAMRVSESLLGESEPEVALRANNLADLHREMGDVQRASELLERAIQIAIETDGSDHPTVGRYYSNLGVVRLDEGRLDEALDLCDSALRIDLAAFGEEHQRIAFRRCNLGRVFFKRGDLTKAISELSLAVDIAKKTIGSRNYSTARFAEHLGLAYQEQGKRDAALDAFRMSLSVLMSCRTMEHEDVVRLKKMVSELQLEQ